MPRFHIDLSHVADHSGLRFAIGGRLYDLSPHTEVTIGRTRDLHPTFRIMPGAAKRFTHFADVRQPEFPQDRLSWIRVVRPNPDPAVYLPEVVLASVYWPHTHLWGYYARKLLADPKYRPAKLAFYGLKRAPSDLDAARNAYVAANQLITGVDTAATLVFHHPELTNAQPYYAATVINDHISPSPDEDPAQYDRIVALQNVVTDPHNQPWSPVIPCADDKGNLMKAAYAIGTIAKGDQLYTQTLTDATTQAALAPVAGAKRTANDDVGLQNQTWSVRPGRASITVRRDLPDTHQKARSAAAAAKPFKWAVDEQQPHHGLSVDSGSITIDGSDNFSIDASNTFLRTLYAYYELLDENGKPISDKTKLGPISSVNSIMGIPAPTDPTTLSFNLVKAPSVNLLFGTLGTSGWDSDVSPKGAVLTGLWQFGIPFIFIIAGAALTDTQPLNKIVSDKLLTEAALKAGETMSGNIAGSGAGTINTRSMMTSMASMLVGMIAGPGMEALGTYLIAQVGEGELSSAFGPVGIVLKLFAAGVNIAEIAVTTGEVLSSPATFTVKVSRTIDVKLTLHPDPAHGEPGNPASAVWPALAQKYLATLQYKDGTTRQIEGAMPAITNNVPLDLDFVGVPAGGEFRVLAGVYSESGWLAGSWQSDWIKAVANRDDGSRELGDFNIKENLVPLTGDTEYVYKESIAYQNGHYVWNAGKPPTATVTSLDPGPNGTIAALVGISMNTSAFQVGYAWRASGQNISPDDANAPPSKAQLYAVQNLSVLAQPDSRLKFSGIGLTLQPSVAYSPSVNHEEIDQTNFILDPRGTASQLRRVMLQNHDGGPTDFGLTADDLESWGSFPLTDLDAIAVHPSSRTVVAVSWKQHKMMLLSLPAAAAKDGQAPQAVMVSGEGVRQGLMKGPKALAMAPDGRILVLESLNQRIQAFDAKGNPVASFIAKPKLFSLTLADVSADLNAGKMPAAMQAALQASDLTFLFEIPKDFVAQLDSAVLKPSGDPLVTLFSAAGWALTYDPKQMGNHAVSSYITVQQPGQSWIITDPGKNLAYQISNQAGTINAFRIVTQVAAHTIQAGQRWTVTDSYAAATWLIQPTFGVPSQLDVFAYVSYAPLYNPGKRADITYLDMATEAQGNVYVLSYVGDGGKPENYVLDVYAPDGSFLFRSPNPSQIGTPQYVAAAKITVDVWRNLYTLDYAPLAKPAGTRPEPGISHWMPTPPLFSLDLTSQPAFDSRNIAVVINDFAAHGITLSPTQTFIEVKSDAGYYQVTDPSVNAHYDVFRSGDALQVYSIRV